MTLLEETYEYVKRKVEWERKFGSPGDSDSYSAGKINLGQAVMAMLEECIRDQNNERLVQDSDKWESGELGQDEEFVKICDCHQRGF